MVCEISRRNNIELISILIVFILLVAFMLPFFNGLAQPLPGNPPVANAGSDKNGYSGYWVYFNGNGSYDPDSDPLQYKWDYGDGNSTGWSSNSSAQHIFGSAGNYTVTLNVTDGTLFDSDICYANITTNNPPVADAGSDQNSVAFQNVNFDGSGSYDPDNDPLQYRWYFGDGDSTWWSGSNTASHAYGVWGNYTVTLYVKDSFNTDTDTCKVNVSPAGGSNVAPVADAGSDKSAYTGQWVHFYGNATDSNGDPLQYRWHFGDGNSTGWSSNSSASHKYTAAGNYIVTLNVTDGALWDIDTCYANITVNNNNPPVADAGSDQNVNSFQNVYFNGNGSYDPDNDPLYYRWNFGDGDGTGWASVPYANHTYENSTGIYTVTLIVIDSQYADSDTCVVTVSIPGGGNNAPVANAGPDKYGKVGQTIYFDGNSSYDQDNDPLTYKWYFGDGASTGWSSSYTASHSYSNIGNYTVKLSVNDGKLIDNDTCTVQIYSNTTPNNPPVSNAGSDKYAKVDQTVYFDGSLSYDPDNDPLTYKWYFGDGASTGWSSSNKASHSYSKIGNYTARLSVYDGTYYDNDTCIAHITAAGGGSNNTNSAPVADAGLDQNGTVNQPVYFDGSGSYDPDNDPLTYKWVFGDGYQTGWQGNSNSSHVYNSTSNYTATIYVSDGKLTDSDSCVIYVTGGGWSPPTPAPPQDSDGDGYYDNLDAFPDDPTQWQDSDGDGRGDNIDGDNPDIFPADPNEWTDTDFDGIGDNADAFPDDHTEWSDYDGDGVGDNTDAFPDDDSEWSDLDGDKVGDNSDAFPSDPTEWADTDGDGVGDNSDAFPNDPSRSVKPKISKGDEPDVFVYVGVIALVMIILIIIKLALIVRKNRRRGGSGPIDNDKLLQKIQDDIIDGNVSSGTKLSQDELEELLESSYRNGEISEATYHYIVDNDLIGYSK